MRVIKKLTDSKFLNIFSIKDPSKGVGNYLYAERLGKDSVAFVCVDRNDPSQIFLNKEYKPPVDKFVLGAFGGSNDKDKSFVGIVIDEVREEAGFIVTEKDVKELGKCLVSTQMNQYCYLFVVFVDKDKAREREPENEIEAMAEVEWVDESEIASLDDWKSIVILNKAKNLSLI